MEQKKEFTLDEIEKNIRLLKLQQKALESREGLMPFIKFTSPDPEDPNDVERSTYQSALHHEAIARVVEEVEKGEIQFLILTVPPRHGKSEIVSRRLPAWFMGRNPDQNVVVATYNDDFAKDFGADVRSIITSSRFRQVFPDVKLLRGGAAKDRLQTTQGGMATFVGVGGSLTGRGAHCFVSGTSVLTTDGSTQIQDIRVGDEVLSFEKEHFVKKRVEAISSRSGARIFRITTASGRVVEATGDHPFYIDGTWVEARELAAGDRLLCAVRQRDGSSGLRTAKAQEARPRKFLLLRNLLGTAREFAALRGKNLLSMWRSYAEEERQGFAEAGADFLLDGVHGNGTARGVRATGLGADAPLRALQRHVHSFERHGEALLSRMRLSDARGADARRREPSLERGSVRQSSEAACDTPISRTTTFGDAAGWEPVRTVLGKERIACPSHRREPVEQSSREPRHSVPAVSHESPLFRREEDFVLRVEDTGRTADVYDIQVEGTHCFFANEILVHNCLIIDDVIKDYEQARSQAFRDRAWEWFTKVAMTRRMGKKLVIITFTRWHTDDIIGRLTDPENEHYNRALAEKIKIINFPAIAEDDDPLGRAPGEALWPGWYDHAFLEEQRSLDPLGFEALYQQRPSVADGTLFRRESLQYHGPDERVKTPPIEELRIFCTSDHAVSTAQRADKTVLLRAGVDRQNNIYLLDCWWRKAPTDAVVEAMLAMVRQEPRPLIWWAEQGHISKSIGPFLRKRMSETGVFFNIVEKTPVSDKEQRAQAISARMAMGRVYFPRNRPWVEKAVNELLAFPNGLHDDFVDAFAWLGLGLQSQIPVKRTTTPDKPAKPGTFGWFKQQQRAQEKRAARLNTGGF